MLLTGKLCHVTYGVLLACNRIQSVKGLPMPGTACAYPCRGGNGMFLVILAFFLSTTEVESNPTV